MLVLLGRICEDRVACRVGSSLSLVGIGLLTVWVRWYYHNGYKACKANQYIVNAIEIR